MLPAAPPRIRPPGLGLHLSLGVGLGLAVSVGLLLTSDPVYQSSTSVLVGSIDAETNLRTEAALVGATQTAADADARLAAQLGQPPTGRLVRVEPVPGTSVLTITFEAASAATAQAGATAYAEAYLAGRREAARAAVDEQIAATQQRLDEVRAELGQVTTQLDTLPPDAAELGSLRAAQESLTTEAAELSARMHELRTTSIDPGRVVAAAALPAQPVWPDRRLVIGLGGAGGLLAGLLLHLVRTRWSRRVRRVTDLRRHQVPVLAERAAVTVSGGLYDRIRNEIVAALKPTDHIILVSAAAPGPAGVVVAANLAAAFARADNDVVLVGAGAPRHELTLAALFDVADIPGLTDVLAGRIPLARAVQPVGRYPRLRIVTPGGSGTAGGLLQSEGARSVLRQLATRTRYVIVAAPSTASGAEAQSLASAADGAVLAVELDRTRHAQIADAVTQLARVGTELLGAVVVPRSTVPDEPAADAWPSPPAYQTEGWIGGRSRLERVGSAPGPDRPGSRSERSESGSRPQRLGSGSRSEGPGSGSRSERASRAALDGPTRALDRLNRSRRIGDRVAAPAVVEAPASPGPDQADPDRPPTTTPTEAP